LGRATAEHVAREAETPKSWGSGGPDRKFRPGTIGGRTADTD